MQLRLCPLAFVACLSCGSSKPDPSDALQECAEPDEIDEGTLIAWDFKTSAREMLICSDLATQVHHALFRNAATLLSEPASAPDSVSFEDGKFRVDQDGTAMNLTVVCGDRSIGCTEGDVIAHNPFDIESYLRGATSGELDGATLRIEYDTPGPLVELLGVGSNPPNPVELSAAELAVFVNNIHQFRLNTVIEFDQQVESSTITYNLKTGRVDIKEVHEGTYMDLELVDASAVRGEQVMSPVIWNVKALEHALDGVIEMNVTGGSFDYLVRLTYGPAASEPFVEMECLSTDSGG